MGDYYEETEGRSGIQKMVGFEMPSEASYFSLLLNTINNQEHNMF
jgi:hypothetical protein